MSWLGLRLTPPTESYDGFKFRMARIICVVFGAFSILFFVKHAVVLHSLQDVKLLPDPFSIIWSYVTAYYLRTASGAAELVLILTGFAATFWLNLPKHYFAGRYRDYGKERASAEAKSVSLLLTLIGLSLVLLSVPFLTLHFPVWVSFLVKYGPVAAGILRYLSVLPDANSIQRMPEISQLDWDGHCFNATYSCAPSAGLAAELSACSSELSSQDTDATRRFLVQGNAGVTWSGVDALFRNLEACLGVRGESISLHDSASRAIEFAVSELLDSRRDRPTMVLTTDSEHKSVRGALERLKTSYRFNLDLAPLQNMLWTNADSEAIVSSILAQCLEKRPDVVVLSHVFSHTGVPVDLKALIEGVRTAGLATLFVVDGSHGVGNVPVADDILLRCAYYAFNGHNWLLGTPFVGVLVRNEFLLRAGGQMTAAAVRRPFSAARPGSASEKIISKEEWLPWIALNYVLRHEWLAVGLQTASQHSRQLAALFRKEMQRRDFRVLPNSADSSIVVVTDVPGIQSLYRALEHHHVKCRMVGADLESGKRAFGIRFCFHHYHDDEDVRDLAEFIGKITADNDTGLTDGGSVEAVAPPERRFLAKSA